MDRDVDSRKRKPSSTEIDWTEVYGPTDWAFEYQQREEIKHYVRKIEKNRRF